MTNAIAGSWQWWLAWLPFCIYYLSGIPQILTNYRNRSTAGVSYRMVFFDYTGALSTTVYTFLLGLPFACRVMEPLCAVNIGILVLQGYYYCRKKAIRRNLIMAYFALHTFCLGMWFLGTWYAAMIGNIMGWISIVVQFFTQLPQVLKNHERKSVQGLSFLYISLLGIAGFFEMVVSYVLGLPVQNFLNGTRGLCYYAVLCTQFYRYRSTMKKAW